MNWEIPEVRQHIYEEAVLFVSRNTLLAFRNLRPFSDIVATQRTGWLQSGRYVTYQKGATFADNSATASTMYSKRPFEDFEITSPDTYDQPAHGLLDQGPNMAKYLQELTEQTFAKFE